jgi:hypothetical protein
VFSDREQNADLMGFSTGHDLVENYAAESAIPIQGREGGNRQRYSKNGDNSSNNSSEDH